MANHYDSIPQEKFTFAQLDTKLHDQKLETKSRGFFADALIRFKKNKSSVVAAYIILAIMIYAIVAPILSLYSVRDMDKVYINTPPYVASIAEKGWGIFDGAVVHESQNDAAYDYWMGIAEETGNNPVIEIISKQVKEVKSRGKMVQNITYKLRTNKYFETGVVYRTFSYEEFDKIQAWQNETGIQVIYPYVETKDIADITNNPNLWYKVNS